MAFATNIIDLRETRWYDEMKFRKNPTKRYSNRIILSFIRSSMEKKIIRQTKQNEIIHYLFIWTYPRKMINFRSK